MKDSIWEYNTATDRWFAYEDDGKVVLGSNEGLGVRLDYDEVSNLANALQKWLAEHAPSEPPAIEDDIMEDAGMYLEYVMRLNESMETIRKGLVEVGKVTKEMDEKKLFGMYRQTLAISEQNFVTSFALYKTLMADAIAALSAGNGGEQDE